MREIGFLGVVIRLERIKIKDWLPSKEIKNMWKYLGLENYY